MIVFVGDVAARNHGDFSVGKPRFIVQKAIINRHPIRAEELDKQLSALLFRYAMPASWADKLRELIDKDEASEKANFVHRVAGDKETIARLSEKSSDYSIAT